MDKIYNLLEDYYEIKDRIALLNAKRKEIRKEIVNYLEKNKQAKVQVGSYSAFIYNNPQYKYDIWKIYEMIGIKDFINIVNIKNSNFEKLIVSNKFSSSEVSDFLHLREVFRLTTYLYVNKVK